MMKVSVEYPDFEAEKNILDLDDKKRQNLDSLMTTDDILEIRDEVDKIYVDEKIKNLIVRIVRGTRPGDEYFSPEYEGLIQAGASPRATIWLQKLGRFMAYLAQRDYVSPDDIMRVIPSVLGHRMILTYEASIDNINARDVALKIARNLV